MKVYLICVLAFILADILTGLVKSLYEKDFKSSVMRQGLFHKAGELMARPGIVDRAEAFAHSMEAALV